MAQNITFEHGEKRATDFLNRHLQDIIPDGVYKGFNIRETGTPSFSVDAKAETDGTNVVFTLEGVRIEEDADLAGVATVTTPDTFNPRIDSLFVKHDKTPAKNPAIFELLVGTPDPSPSAPTPPVDGFFRVKLADILVPANATEITNTEITNAAKTSLGFVPVPFATLSDISADEANAFNGMAGRGFNEPSVVNPVATIRDTNGPFLKPSPTNPADDFLQVKGGESWNRRQLVKTTVADASIQIITAPSTNPRIDLVTYDPDTQALAIISGAESASPVAPVLTDPGLMPVAFVLVDEISPASIVVNEADITDARALPHNKTPEWFDLPGITSDMKDAVTGAAAPDASNVFQTEADLNAAIDPFARAFAFSRVRLENGITVGDQSVLQNGALITCADAGFTKLKTVRLTSGNLVAIGGAGVGPGGLEQFGTFAAATFYHIYLIAKSAGPAPEFDADLVISTNPTAPDLGGGLFPGFDIFRRLVSIKTGSTPIWKKSITINGATYYVDLQNFNTATIGVSSSFIGGPNPLSFASVVPATSRRCEIRTGELSSPSGGAVFHVTHGDDPQGATGGRQGGTDTGTGGGNGCTIFADLNASQQVRIRVTGPVSGSIELQLHGYFEDL